MGSPFASASSVRRAPSLRLILAVFFVLIGLHYILSYSYSGYSSRVSFSSLSSSNSYASSLSTEELLDELVGRVSDISVISNMTQAPPERANAAIVMLARNREVNDVAASMKQLEDRFNSRYGYPWVFLNDEPFSEEFIRRTSQLTRANVSYGVIPSEHWNQPEWIDEDKARNGRTRLILQNVIYGGSVPYRNMCRFNSGFFFKHPLLLPYRYYWRVEPGVKFFCDMDYDPFLMMQQTGKVYGFTISLYEWESTIPTLWPTVKEFIKEHPEYVAKNNAMKFLSDNGGESYNLCHFWSNFEIADMEFWRSPAYQAFFDYLESKGGFYYERWGDAPVHSIAAALFAEAKQIHIFKDIGYRHDPFQRCPQGELHSKGKCWCDPGDSFDYAPNSCMKRFEDVLRGYGEPV